MIQLVELWCLFIFSRIHTYCAKKAACETNLDDKWTELKWEVQKDYAEARRWWKKRLRVLSVPWAGSGLRVYFCHGGRLCEFLKTDSMKGVFAQRNQNLILPPFLFSLSCFLIIWSYVYDGFWEGMLVIYVADRRCGFYKCKTHRPLCLPFGSCFVLFFLTLCCYHRALLSKSELES